jgi:uncharacterized membrane protein
VTEALLTPHVLSAGAWIGGGLFATFAYRRLLRTTGADTIVDLDQSVAGRYFPLSVVVVLLSGVALVLESDVRGWTTGFVVIGLVVIVLSGVL